MEVIDKNNLKILQSKMTTKEEFDYDTMFTVPLYSLLSQYDIDRLYNVATSIRYAGDAVKKKKAILDIMHTRGFAELSAGTNRICFGYLEDPSICVKVAADRTGIKDNPREFLNQGYLKPFCTKVFETSPCGTVGLFERVRPIKNREEFYSVAAQIYELIDLITSKFILADFGTHFFMNYGFREFHNFGPVILDFPYLYEADARKLVCKKPLTHPDGHVEMCGGLIDYDLGFNKLICTKCGATYRAVELAKYINDNLILQKGNKSMANEIKVSLIRGNKVTKMYDTVMQDEKSTISSTEKKKVSNQAVIRTVRVKESEVNKPAPQQVTGIVKPAENKESEVKVSTHRVPVTNNKFNKKNKHNNNNKNYKTFNASFSKKPEQKKENVPVAAPAPKKEETPVQQEEVLKVEEPKIKIPATVAEESHATMEAASNVVVAEPVLTEGDSAHGDLAYAPGDTVDPAIYINEQDKWSVAEHDLENHLIIFHTEKDKDATVVLSTDILPEEVLETLIPNWEDAKSAAEELQLAKMDIRKLEETIEKLQKENEELKKQNEDLRASDAENIKLLKDGTDLYDKVVNEKAAIQDELDSANEAVEALQTQLTASARELEETKAKSSQFEQYVDKANAEIEQLKTEIAALKESSEVINEPAEAETSEDDDDNDGEFGFSKLSGKLSTIGNVAKNAGMENIPEGCSDTDRVIVFEDGQGGYFTDQYGNVIVVSDINGKQLADSEIKIAPRK